MKNTAAKISTSFRERNHRFTALPVKDVLKIQMKDLGIKNVDLQQALQYAKPNVIAMMKTGSMRLPANKVTVAAKLLQLDPIFLLGKVVAESDPDLWDVIFALLGDRLVTANEMALVRLARGQLDGHDVSLVDAPEFTLALASALNTIRQRQNSLAAAAINRVDES